MKTVEEVRDFMDEIGISGTTRERTEFVCKSICAKLGIPDTKPAPVQAKVAESTKGTGAPKAGTFVQGKVPGKKKK